MEGWREVTLQDIAIINPIEKLAPGQKAPKIPMDALQPFCKKPTSMTIEPYNGGMKFKNHDILVARITPCLENGKTAYIDLLADGEIGFGSTEYIVLRKKYNKSESDFLYYFCLSEQFRDVAIASMSGSSGRQRVQNDVIKHHCFLFPQILEQQAIAAVLSSLDDKIDLLHRQNKTLEALAQTLFRQWFVEEVDEGKERNITDFIDFNPKRKLEKGKSAPYIEMSALSSTSFAPSTWYSREFSSGTKFINGDTLLARITPCLENGKAAFIQCLEDGETAWGSTEYIVLRPKTFLHPLFAYALVKTADFRDHAESCLAGSSGRQRIELPHLMQYNLVMPKQERVCKFNACMEALMPRLAQNAKKICTLTTLRDTLLPKLMSGEVRVYDE